MSKGPGTRQRAILDALEELEYVRLQELYQVGDDAEVSAFCRAARKLWEQGKVQLQPASGRGYPTIVARIGYKNKDFHYLS